jgi:hypothetical protein
VDRPGDDSQRSSAYGSNEIIAYLHRGLPKVATTKQGEPTVPFSFVDGVVTAVSALPWPCSASHYMFKQSYVLC